MSHREEKIAQHHQTPVAMLPFRSDQSSYEDARRAGLLVFRGYAEYIGRKHGYPMPISHRLLAESPSYDTVMETLKAFSTKTCAPARTLESFRIVEILPDLPYEPMRYWYFDRQMMCVGRCIEDSRIPFQGRDAGDCRFAMDEMVECWRGTRISIGKVLALPLTEDEVQKGKSRGLEIWIGTDPAAATIYADQSDNVYLVDYLDETCSDGDFDFYPECRLRKLPAGKL